MLLESEVQLRS